MPKTGPALKLTNDELDKLAEITEEDVELVNKEWKRAVPAWARNLLVANAD